MSDPQFKKFLLQIAGDSQLQDQLKGVTDKAGFTDTFLRLAKAQGYAFTAADVEANIAKNQKNPLEELSEADLALVAGGLKEYGGRPAASSDGCTSAWTTLFGWCS